MSTTDNTAINAMFTDNSIAIGAVKPLDVKTLLGVYGAAVKADGMVSIDAETLRKMTEELIMAKFENITPIISRSNVGQSGHGFINLSDHRDIKPIPGHVHAIMTVNK